jgi:hypothetical protein
MMIGLNDYESVKDGKIKKPEWMEPFVCKIPPCKKGKWEIRKFNVEMDLTNLREMRSGRGSFPGEYTQLIHADRGIIMSDTIAEIEDCRIFYRRAYGRVLIHGLGLGCLLQALLLKDNVEHIDVVEIDQDVIDLVSPHFSEDIEKGRLGLKYIMVIV